MTVELENLRKWEKIDIVIRRHWIVFLLLLLYFIGAVTFSVIFIALWKVDAFSVLSLSVFWMFYAMFLYVTWLNYELDIFVFTNNRVICVEQKSFLNRAVGETTLDKVQEVWVQTKGLLANIFGYGTLSIMTAGATPSFDMTFSPNALENQRHINNLVDRYRDALYGGTATGKGRRWWTTWKTKIQKEEESISEVIHATQKHIDEI